VQPPEGIEKIRSRPVRTAPMIVPYGKDHHGAFGTQPCFERAFGQITISSSRTMKDGSTGSAIPCLGLGESERTNKSPQVGRQHARP
jgi:hypothetical protein